jgi:hypothetical protein
MTDAEKKTQYLSEVDLILQPMSFCHRKNANDWRRKIDDRNELWIHINFGKAVVNPSFGVTYLDFESTLPKSVRSVSGTMIMLSSVASPADGYLIDEGSRRVTQDLLEHGIPFLSCLSDRAFAIERLASATVKDWPAPSYSDRIRLLPLLLATENRIDEAFEYLKRFLAESSSRDQIIPRYDVFANAFSETFGR